MLVHCMLKMGFFGKFKKFISQKVLKQSLPNFTLHWTLTFFGHVT